MTYGLSGNDIDCGIAALSKMYLTVQVLHAKFEIYRTSLIGDAHP